VLGSDARPIEVRFRVYYVITLLFMGSCQCASMLWFQIDLFACPPPSQFFSQVVDTIGTAPFYQFPGSDGPGLADGDPALRKCMNLLLRRASPVSALIDRIQVGGRFPILSEGGCFTDLVGSAIADVELVHGNEEPLTHSQVRRQISYTFDCEHARPGVLTWLGTLS
jgi:hypothetical protein